MPRTIDALQTPQRLAMGSAVFYTLAAGLTRF